MSKPRALIADDVFESRELLKRSLQSLGFTVVAETADGSSTLEKIEKFKPDIAFIDIEMPGMSGLEVLEKIQQKELEVYPVIISACNSVGNVKDALGKGAKGFIVKPYNHTKIEEMYNAFMETYAPSKPES